MKKILLSLLWIITIWLINFSSAWLIQSTPISVGYYDVFDFPYKWTNWSFYCIIPNHSLDTISQFWVSSTDWSFYNYFNIFNWSFENNISNSSLCIFIPDSSVEYMSLWKWTLDWFQIYYEEEWWSSWECEEWTWNNWSSLYINDIQHNSASTIDITIPEEISRDYTNENDLFELNVEWYNVDYEYMENVINKQNYIPTTEDLSNVISSFGLFGGLLVVCLFVILVFYMIKKIFN